MRPSDAHGDLAVGLNDRRAHSPITQ
jgi:hypothetical protein